MYRVSCSAECVRNISRARPIAKSSPMLFVPLPSGAMACMSVRLGVSRGKTRQAPAPQGPGAVVRGFLRVRECSVRGGGLSLVSLAEPSVYAIKLEEGRGN